MPVGDRFSLFGRLTRRGVDAFESAPGRERDAIGDVQRQEIQAQMQENVTLTPRGIRRWFATNVFQRSLSHLVAKSATLGQIFIRCSDAGKLHVTSFPEEFDLVETFAFSQNNVGSDDFSPTFNFSLFELWINGEDAEVRIQKLDDTFTAWIPLKQGYYERAFVGKQIQIRSASATLTTGDINVYGIA